jgi:hypothetical protein
VRGAAHLRFHSWIKCVIDMFIIIIRLTLSPFLSSGSITICKEVGIHVCINMLDCDQMINRDNKRFRTEISSSSSLLIDVASFKLVDAFESPEVTRAGG